MPISKIFFAVFWVVPFLFFFSCAHIPQESVQLSQVVGKGIAEQNRAYTNLLNEYFELKKKTIDDFITSTYTPTLFSNIRSKMKAEGVTEIPDSVSQQIVKIIVAKRDSMQSSLERVRVSILTSGQENTILLSNANEAVTSLLSSAVSVNNSAKRALQMADSLTGSKFKFAEFDKTFDQYLTNVANGSARANDLYDEVTQISKGGK